MTTTSLPVSVETKSAAAHTPVPAAGGAIDPTVTRAATEKSPFAAMLARDVDRHSEAKREDRRHGAQPEPPPDPAVVASQTARVVPPMPAAVLLPPLEVEASTRGDGTEPGKPPGAAPGLDPRAALPGAPADSPAPGQEAAAALTSDRTAPPTTSEPSPSRGEDSSRTAGAAGAHAALRKPDAAASSDLASETGPSRRPAAPSPGDAPPQQTAPAHPREQPSLGEPKLSAAAPTDTTAVPSRATHKEPAARADTGEPPSMPAGSEPSVATTPGTAGEIVALPVAPALTAKNMTPVMDSSPAAPARLDVARARLLDAVTSAANQGVIQRAATGVVEVPGWGRVAVRAERVGASVDVRVAAEHEDMHSALHGAQGALAADLRRADVPLGQLRLEHGGASFGAEKGFASGDRGARSDGGHREATPSDEEAERAQDAAVPSRVRIVL